MLTEIAICEKISGNDCFCIAILVREQDFWFGFCDVDIAFGHIVILIMLR